MPELNVKRIFRLPGHRTPNVGASRKRFYLDALLLARGLTSAMSGRPDIIHAHLHEGALLGKLIGALIRRPVVFDFQGSLTSEMIDHGFINESNWAHRPLRWLEGQIDRRVDAILTSSKHGADLLAREFGCEGARVFPVPDAVDCDRFRPAWSYSDFERRSVRRQLGIPAGRKIIAYLGLLAEYQGCGLMLKAFARLIEQHQDVHLLIMGYPGQDRYQRMADELGISNYVTLAGRVPYLDAPRYLACASAAVSAKVSATESNGKLLNYMAAGLPTVTFDTPVCRELLGDAGVYAGIGDVGSLAQMMELLVSDEDEAQARGRALRERAENRFTWGKAAEQIIDVYDMVTGR